MRTSVIALVLVACGGSSPDPQHPGGGGGSGSGSGKPGAPGDDMLDVKLELKGGVFEPDALGYPGIPRVSMKPETGAKLDASIKKQREVVAKAKDLTIKEAEVARLTTMLYNKASES